MLKYMIYLAFIWFTPRSSSLLACVSTLLTSRQKLHSAQLRRMPPRWQAVKKNPLTLYSTKINEAKGCLCQFWAIFWLETSVMCLQRESDPMELLFSLDGEHMLFLITRQEVGDDGGDWGWWENGVLSMWQDGVMALELMEWGCALLESGWLLTVWSSKAATAADSLHPSTPSEEPQQLLHLPDIALASTAASVSTTTNWEWHSRLVAMVNLGKMTCGGDATPIQKRILIVTVRISIETFCQYSGVNAFSLSAEICLQY